MDEDEAFRENFFSNIFIPRGTDIETTNLSGGLNIVEYSPPPPENLFWDTDAGQYGNSYDLWRVEEPLKSGAVLSMEILQAAMERIAGITPLKMHSTNRQFKLKLKDADDLCS